MLIALLMVGSLAGGLAIAQSRHSIAAAPAQSSAPTVNAGAGLPAAAIPMSGFAPVVKQAVPAIVNISSVMLVKTDAEDGIASPFNWLPGFQPPQRHRERGAGSGVIVGTDGYILTNNHVVDNATEVKVALSDKREFKASVIGTDAKSDLALLKVNATNLAALPLGDSSTVQVGDIALAIGNPYGLGQTVTMGIVSALGRGGLGIEDYEDFIQTDAAINPGNSGGALLNTRGELIGINTAILSNGGGNQGIGFAIPSNMGRKIMTQIKDHGHVTRGWLGLEIQEMDSALAKAFGLKDGKGALVSGIVPDGPAARAGVEKGDVIREINGQIINDSRELRLKIAETVPDSKVEIKIVHNGSERTLSMTVGTMPTEKMAANTENPATRKIGVAVQEMNPEIAQELGIPSATRGVVIVQVQPESPAGDSGLREGDVIQEVNHQPIKTVSEFKDAVNHSSNSILLLVSRDGRSLYTVVDRDA
jgi:serine protease Do